MSDIIWSVGGVVTSLLAAFLLWYLVEDEQYRQRIERGYWKRSKS